MKDRTCAKRRQVIWGGKWTEEKLDVFEKYLRAYHQIFHTNTRAKSLDTVYVDAFAGSGVVQIKPEDAYYGIKDEETGEFFWPLAGSASRALSLMPGFDRYVLIDKDPANATHLREVVTQYPDKVGKVTISCHDCNLYIPSFVRKTDWSKTRALVLLDPFAMSLDWSTIHTLSSTKAVDLWILFPLHAVNRMLPRDGEISERWASKLTRFFGDDGWKTAFYRVAPQQSLFSQGLQDEKSVNLKGVTQYFNKRLADCFPHVVEEPMILRNQANIPIFAFMFAASNPKGGDTAVKIAKDIVGRSLVEHA